MKLAAGSVGRVLASAFLLITGLAVAAPAAASAAPPTATKAPPTAIKATPKAIKATPKAKPRRFAADPAERAWREHFVAHPVPAPASAKAPQTPIPEGLRAKAAREAFRQATTDACSGQIAADTLISCQTPSPTGTDTYTLTLPAGANVLAFQTVTSNDDSLPITVTAPDSTTVGCQDSQFDACQTSQSGTYTVAVQSDQSDYTLEFTALLSESSCPAASLSFSSASVTGTLTAGQPGACYSISAASGDTVRVYEGPFDQQVDVAIFDAGGNLVCAQFNGNCTLTGTGPYRVLAADSGQAESYEFRIADLTNPAGCLVVAQQHFGAVPASSADMCSSLTVTTSGSYQIYGVDATFATQSGTLYAADGSQACTEGARTCQLAPGTYSFVQDFMADGLKISTVFISATQSQGCVSVSDTSFASGDATGSFDGPGEELCRTLPTKSGRSDYLYGQPVSSGSAGQVLAVLDSTGTQMCPNAFEFSGFGTCALTGTAPFRVILVPTGPSSQFRLLVQRTDSTLGCGSWPTSPYGNSAGAHATLTKTDDAKCFVIPAAGRSASEVVQEADATDGAEAGFAFEDPSGSLLCEGNGEPTTWSICHYKPGVTYTALLINLRIHDTDTYELARRDLSATAACSAPASTTPGGPTTTFALGSSVAARCFHVSAAATDKFIFNLRESAPTDSSAFQTPSAVLVIANSAGTEVCGFTLVCPVSGSAGFQAVVLSNDYTDVGITAHLDSWRVATSAGWAPACTKHTFSNGTTSAALSGTLTDSSDLFCGVVNLSPNRLFTIFGSDTATGFNSLFVNAYTADSFTTPDSNGICGTGGDSLCDFGPFQPDSQAVLIATPFYQSQDPISFDLQGVCTNGCTAQRQSPVFKSVSPASQVQGPSNTLVLTGTGLDFSTPFALSAQNGQVFEPAVPLAVNAAGTKLTLRLDTSDVPAGTYDVSTGGSCSPGPCPGTLLKAYTVTKAPSPPPAAQFVPVAPKRVLTTQVKAHATDTFQVGGRAGVPAAHLAAVTLDVTASNPAKTGFLTVFPAKRARPSAQMVEFKAGQSMTGLVTVPVVGGKASVYNGSAGGAKVTADVVGYDTTKPSSGSGTGLRPLTPARILSQARVNANKAHVLTVAGVDGIPSTGAKAVALDVTVTAPAKAGHLIAYADNTGRPAVTSLSWAAGQSVTDLVIARVTNGKVDLVNSSPGGLKLSVDAIGYYAAGGLNFHALTAQRVMDTRTGFGEAGGAILARAADRLGAMFNASAVELNVTVLGAKSPGALEAFEDGPLYEDGVTLPNSTSLPGTSSLSFSPGQAQSSLVIVPTGSFVDFYNGSNASIQVLADVVGYYTNP